MKIIVDTNILVRAVSDDDPVQSPVARRLLADAAVAVVSTHTLCEFDWVMRRFYHYPRPAVLVALETICAAANVVTDVAAVAAGLVFLAAGGDFADGIIAFDGRRLGGEVFASFDAKARRVAAAAGYAVVDA